MASGSSPEDVPVAQRPQLRKVVAAKLTEDWSPAPGKGHSTGFTPGPNFRGGKDGQLGSLRLADQIARWMAQRYEAGFADPGQPRGDFKSLFIQSRDVLAKKLQKHLRSQRPIRRSVQNTVTGQSRSQIAGAVSIHRTAQHDPECTPGAVTSPRGERGLGEAPHGRHAALLTRNLHRACPRSSSSPAGPTS